MSSQVVMAVVATKGGVGKTTVAANTAGLLADLGFRVLCIDADVQPSLSKFYPLHSRAEFGIVELLLGNNSEETIRSCISSTIYPNLDIVLSNNITSDIQIKVQSRPDRPFLLRTKLTHPLIQSNYDVIIIDTQGAVGALQDAASFTATMLITPVMPEVLSAREFLTGTQEALNRLKLGTVMGLPVPPLKAVIYGQDRTKDARMISDEIKSFFNKEIDGKRQLLSTVIPHAKAYKEAASLRIPVHCHEKIHAGKSESAYDVMHSFVYDLFPALKENALTASCFGNMAQLLEGEAQ